MLGKRRRTRRSVTRKRFRRSQRTFRLRRRGLARTIKRVLLRNAETKFQFFTASNVVLEHNELRVVAGNLLACQQGDGQGNRAGDKVFAKHLTIKMYFENQQYRPRVGYTILVLRNKANPSSSITNGENIFEGINSTKSIDFIDYNKYDIIYKKAITVSNAGSYPGTGNTMGTGGIDGAAEGQSSHSGFLTNPNKYRTLKIRLNKNVQYLDGTDLPSTMRYTLAVIPYINNTSTTSGGTYPAGHVTMTGRFVFKDP